MQLLPPEFAHLIDEDHSNGKKYPVDFKLFVVKFHHENHYSMIETAQHFNVSKRALMRWLQKFTPKPIFVPITLDSPEKSTIIAPFGTIPVTITMPAGTVIQLQLRCLAEIAQLIKSLKSL